MNIKKLFLIAFLLFCVIGGILTSKNVFFSSESSGAIISPTVVSPKRSIQSEVEVNTPAKLIIPSLSVNAVVEEVGLDRQGRIDVPKNVYNTGWYKQGVKPGEAGSAVIDGHLDTPTGAPSVFYNLKQLKKGETVVIQDAAGKKLTFVVERVASYPLESIPMAQIVEKTSEKRLNLITCGGEWDDVKKIYRERTVAYTKLSP